MYSNITSITMYEQSYFACYFISAREGKEMVECIIHSSHTTFAENVFRGDTFIPI